MTIIVEENTTLKAFTDNHYAQASFFWQYLIKNKEIKVNGVKVGKDIPLKKGDEVSYFLTPKQREKSAYRILFEDENFLIVDKESGVNAEAVYADLQRKCECYFIHRLDRNTQGLMAFARTKKAEEALLKAFKDRRVEKEYHAAVWGTPKTDGANLTAYLKKEAEGAFVKVFDSPREGAEKIVTEYALEESFSIEGEKISVLAVTLHTGKTHQIRAHLAHIGLSIVGDMKYGDSEKNRRFKVERQRLVAKRLRFNLNCEFSYMVKHTFTSNFDVNEGLLPKK